MNKEFSESGEVPEPTVAKDRGLGETGASSMQGDLKWTAHEGTDGHAAYQAKVDELLDDTDSDMNVYNNEYITRADQTVGVIDTRINNVIYDYKTNDMSRWSLRDAERYGHEHGTQVRSYVDSPDTPADARGYVIAVGRYPQSEEIWNQYAQTIESYGVGVKYAAGGEPEDVVRTVREAYEEASNQDL